MNWLRIFEEVLPVATYAFRRKKLVRLADAADLVKQRPAYQVYNKISIDGLKERIAEEQLRSTALDEKTFKMTLALTVGLTVVGTVFAVLLTAAGAGWLAKTLAWLVWLSVFYTFTSGFLALGGLRTERSFGYGTPPQLLSDKARKAFYADALPRQELMNQVRHLRNEASYQSMRNGFILLFLAMALFAMTKLLGFETAVFVAAPG